MPERDIATDRRGPGDRRARDDGDERRGQKKVTSPLVYVLRSLGLVVVLVLVIVYAVAYTRPIYSTSGTLGDALRRTAPGILPPDSSQVDQFMATAKFQEEKRNFYEDVMRLKQVDSARADSIAQVAVREAYVRGISPAIIFGVMLTENSRFVSNAKSNVGAVGLMQVYPRIWLTKEMSALFGKDLATDSTNVKYGVFILSTYFRPRTKAGDVKEQDWSTALLRYNGCVHGTNTPRCHTYPGKVKNFVEGSATSICNGRSFYDCIAKPFVAGLFGKSNGEGTTATSDGAVQTASPPAATPAPASPVGPLSPMPPAVKPAAKAAPKHPLRKSTRTTKRPVTRRAKAAATR